jgi:molybdopterin/thiamine biosynthesis adenylyltransferase
MSNKNRERFYGYARIKNVTVEATVEKLSRLHLKIISYNI